MKILFLLPLFFSLSVFAAKTKEIAKVGIVFVDNGTFEVTLVRYGDVNDKTYLVKFDGADDPNSGKVFLVTETGGGTGATYYEKEDGGNFLRAPAHEYFGWEAYVGGKTYKINQDKKKTKSLNTAQILSAYKPAKK